MSSSITLIANPTACCATPRKLKEVERLLRAGGREVKVLLTKKRGDAEVFAREVSSETLSSETRPETLIIAAGGDGTFNEVANGLIAGGRDPIAGVRDPIARTQVPMAIIPLGSTNVLAKEIGIPEDIKGAVKKALSGRAHSVSLGKITFTSGSTAPFDESQAPFRSGPRPVAGGMAPLAKGRGSYFCLMAGIGFDARSVYGVNDKLKRLSTKAAHILSGLKSLLSWNPEMLFVTIDGKPYRGYSLIVSNSGKYAGDFIFAPEASMEEPFLHVFLMHGRRRRDIVRYAFCIVTGRHLGLRDITYVKAENIDVKGSAYVQVDGDCIGKTPVAVTIVPDALKLVY